MATIPLPNAENRPSGHIRLRTGNRGLARFDSGLHHLQLVAEDGTLERVDLGFAGSRLLARLLRDPGEVVSREELIGHAWPKRVVGQGSLNQQVYTLRQILGDEKNREIIQTLPRRGYLFNPAHVLAEHPNTELSEAVRLQAPVAELPPLPALLPEATRSKGPLLGWAACAGILATTIAAAAGYLYSSPTADDSRYQLGELEVLLLETDPKERQRLKDELQPTLARLVKQLQKPQRLAVSQSSDYYALHCVHGSRSYTLSSHRQQLEQISDSALQRCLQ